MLHAFGDALLNLSNTVWEQESDGIGLVCGVSGAARVRVFKRDPEKWKMRTGKQDKETNFWKMCLLDTFKFKLILQFTYLANDSMIYLKIGCSFVQ